MMKRLYSLLLALSLCFSLLCFPALAAEIEGPVYETIIGGYDDVIMPRASSTPDLFYNLGLDDNYYKATLIDLAATKGSYTMYYFATSTGHIYLKCELERSGTTTDKTRQLQILLYEKADATSAGVQIGSSTINFSGPEITVYKSFSGLDANKFYYIRFFNNSSTSSSSSMDISGSIFIDDVTFN